MNFRSLFRRNLPKEIKPTVLIDSPEWREVDSKVDEEGQDGECGDVVRPLSLTHDFVGFRFPPSD